MQPMAEMDLTTMSLALAAVLFALGVAGVVIRRNVIILMLCIELMLNAVNLAFVAFSRTAGIDGQIFVFFVMTVAAAEAAVGLALVIAIFRHLETVDMKNFNLLRW
jgi:NADH-quinone oxidoreductase subunit K